MLTLRKRVLLIAGGILVVAVGILLFVLLRKKDTPLPTTETPLTTEPTIELPPIENVEYRRPENLPQETVTQPGSPDEIYAKQTARIFVERFWSYSNQNDNQHIDDALELSLESMHGWITSQSQIQSSLYQGVTTEVLSTRIVSYTPEKTTVEIGARQTVRATNDAGTTTTETKTITARVDLAKVDTAWKVEGIWMQ